MQKIKKIGALLFSLCFLLSVVSCKSGSNSTKLENLNDNVFKPSQSYSTYIKCNENDYIKLNVNAKKSDKASIVNNLSGENITNDTIIFYSFNNETLSVKCTGVISDSSNVATTTQVAETVKTNATVKPKKKKQNKKDNKTLKITTEKTLNATSASTTIPTVTSTFPESKLNQTIKFGDCIDEYRIENSSKIVFIKNSLACKYSLEFCISQEQGTSGVNQISTLIDTTDVLEDIFSIFSITSVSENDVPKNAEQYIYDVKFDKFLNKKINPDINTNEVSTLSILKENKKMFYNYASFVYLTSVPLDNDKGDIDVSYTYNVFEFNDEDIMEHVLQKKYKQKELKMINKKINKLNTKLIKVDNENYLPLFILDCDNSKLVFTWNHSSLVNNEFLEVSDNPLATEEKIAKNMSIILN